MNRLNLKTITNQKNLRKITCLTAYTSSIAKIIDKHVDIILVGDSVGTVIYGMENTQDVTLDMMMAHGKAVVKSSKRAFTVIDMPYHTYRNNNEALTNAKKLIHFTNCQSIKLEANNNNIKIISHLVKNKIKVVSHIGVTPQDYKNFNKIRSVGNTIQEKEKILNLAIDLEKAGSSMIVLECMKENLAKEISKKLKIPTIGIGASLECDGQVLVINDILETQSLVAKPKFIKSYVKLNDIIEKAVKKYCLEVVSKKFPKKNNTYF